MRTEVIKHFLKVQCCTLVLVLALLPEFNLLSMMTGIDFNIPMLICKLICVVGIGLELFKLYQTKQERQEPLPIPFLALNGGGTVLALLSLIPSMPDWLSYVALIALFISLFMTKSIWLVQWTQLPTQGAYLILLAVLMHIFNFVNNTVATSIAAFVGLILYFIGLGKIKEGLDNAGLAAIGKLKLAIVIGLLALVFDLVPLMGWLATLLAIAAFILEFIGYGKLKNSTSIGEEGIRGAGMLRNSMIVMAVASLASLASDAFSGFISLVALFMLFSGWAQIIMGIETKE